MRSPCDYASELWIDASCEASAAHSGYEAGTQNVKPATHSAVGVLQVHRYARARRSSNMHAIGGELGGVGRYVNIKHIHVSGAPQSA